MHLDNLVSGCTNVNEIENLKQKSIEFISKRSFNSNKWDSNIPYLESTSHSGEAACVKQILVVQ